MGKGCRRNPYFDDATTDAAECPHSAGGELAAAAERWRSAVGRPPQAATLAGAPSGEALRSAAKNVECANANVLPSASGVRQVSSGDPSTIF